MLTFYYSPGSCALASHIALAEAGADYALQRIDFSRAEQKSPAYLAINPKARVPALVTPRGVLTETPAILAYVAQSYPEARLAPIDDPFAFAEVQAFNAYLSSTVHVAHAHRMRAYRWADEPQAIAAMQKKVPQSVGECFALIEQKLLTGPWVMGAQYTLADCYLFTLAQWVEADGVDAATIPRVIDHRARVKERPAVKKAIAEEAAA
jgi:glutathione S-transferase